MTTTDGPEVGLLTEPIQPAPTPTSPAMGGGQYTSASPIIYDLYATPNAAGTSVTVTCTTDVACILGLDYTLSKSPQTPTHVAEGAATRFHTLATGALPASPPPQGQVFVGSVGLDPTDITGLVGPPREITTRIPGARAAAGLTVPVRFYNFGGTTPPAAGGGTSGYSWNSYAWAQYAPKGTSFPS